MGWFIPLGVFIGVMGTRAALRARLDGAKLAAWWLLLVLAWLPALCWLLAQLVAQD